MNLQETMDKHGIHKYVVIGSYALGVCNESSDIDIVTTQIPKGLKDYQEFNLEEYFIRMPLGNSRLIKANIDRREYDFIIVEDKTFDGYVKAMKHMKGLPVEVVRNKITRVHIFMDLLGHYGVLQHGRPVNEDDEFPF